MSLFDYRLVKLRQVVHASRTNSPRLSGDSFASLVDYHAYGQSGQEAVDVQLLAQARSIFVNADRLVHLLTGHRGVINAKVLVTGNSDTNWNRPPLLPQSILLWLAQNCALTNPVARTLPIGIENLRLGGRGLPHYYRKLGRPGVPTAVFVPPMSNSNPIRAQIVSEALQRPDIFIVRTRYLRTPAYFQLAKNFRFVLCLEGNGYDNHRIWETLYFGNFPVLLSTPWSRSLEHLGLPILFVDSLGDITSERLSEFNRQHRDFEPASVETLWIPYWKALIDANVAHW